MAFPKPIDGSKLPLDTKGDLIVFGKKNERLPVGTNGQVLTADSAQTLGVKWATPSGGSGGGLERWAVPAGTDLGYDDEFDNGSIDGDWVAVDVTSYENEWYEPTGIKGLSCYAPSGKGAYKLCGMLRPFTGLSTPFYIETAIKITGRNAGFPMGGLIFADGVSSGSGKQIACGFHPYHKKIAYVTYKNYTSRVGIGEFEQLGYPVNDRLYLRLLYSAANTFSMYFSPDGVVWYLAHDGISYTITPTYFGVCQNTEDNSTYPSLLNFAYFRVRSGSPSNG